ncbi:MAG: YggT family protein [Clostridiales bacterium]|nr:YggT family protein [Clostridiales bacterium]
MGTITSVITIIVLKLFQLLEILLFVRAILSWIPNFSQGKVASFVYFTTEPILVPIRSMLMRVNALRNLPVDFSIVAAYLLIEMIRQLLIALY